MMRFSIKDLPIRYKLLVSFSAVCISAISLGSLASYALMRNTIEARIESELTNITQAILNMVKTGAAVSIKNRLRGVAEKNLEIVAYFYGQYRAGRLTEAEARSRAGEVLLSQTIGSSGYIYCIDSSGVCVLHPKPAIVGVDFSHRAFIQEQTSRKTGYIEYDWKNPEDQEARPKALYMTYFAPWDWIISASSYRDEFSELVAVADFRESILSIKFGQNGYSFIIDSKGNVVLHPEIEGQNTYDEVDEEGNRFVAEVCRRKSGKIIYSWKNPGDAAPRKKLAMFNYIPELDWIVESSGYLEEFYGPLKTLRNLMLAGTLAALVLVLVVTFSLSSAITSPIKDLMHRFARGATGDFSARVEKRSNDEVGQLSGYFNTFMEKLEAYDGDLREASARHQRTAEALKISEEMFSKAFRLNPSGIALTSLRSGRFIDANDAFLRSTGYARAEIIGKTAADIRLIRRQEDRLSIMAALRDHDRVRQREFEFRTRAGDIRTGLLSAEVIDIRDEPCMLSHVEDVTEARRLEREIMTIGDRERRKIGRDIHDDLCPHLIGIEGLVRVMKRRLEKAGSAEAAATDQIERFIREAIDKSRRLARGLCPVYLVDRGLEHALAELARNTSLAFGIPCALSIGGTVGICDTDTATHLFHIVQEALNNAARHSGARHIAVDVVADAVQTAVTVTDDGAGMPANADTAGMGLRIMRHRAGMIGGSLEVRPAAGGGTAVRITLRNPADKGMGA